MNPDDFFSHHSLCKKLFAAVCQGVETLGETSIRVTKSQIAFCRKRNFAVVWMPIHSLKGRTAPLVRTISVRTIYHLGGNKPWNLSRAGLLTTLHCIT